MKIELTNMDIALYALYKLEGVSKKVHTERIAFEAYLLAKERFSWRLPEFKEKGFPDKSPVRFALEQAKKKNYGGLVAGRAGGDVGGNESEGWQFTGEGVSWIKNNLKRIEILIKDSAPVSEKLQRHDATRILRKLKTENIFIIYKKNQSLKDAAEYHFTDMLSCTPDASKEIIRKKFDSISAKARLINDKEINMFLNLCKERYGYLLD